MAVGEKAIYRNGFLSIASGNRPDDERKNRGQVENRVLKKTPGDTKTQANTGFFCIGPNFENHVFQENPGKRPTESARKGVKSKIVF
jgi:hypothetical protein